MTDDRDTNHDGERQQRSAPSGRRGVDVTPPLPRRSQPAPRRSTPRGGRDGATPAADQQLPPVTVLSRAERGQRMSRERAIARNRIIAVAVAAALLILLIGVAVVALGGEHSVVAKLGGSKASASSLGANGLPVGTVLSTPIFAKVGDVSVYLPVEPKTLTAVMFHQAARGNSYDITSLNPAANRAAIFKAVKGGAKLPLASSVEITGTVHDRDGKQVLDGTWQGKVVRVYRMNRTGKPDSAADVGALAGTVVVAPVSGTVTKIKPYKLYSRYPDFEIHIKPDAMPKADLVVIHVQDLTVHTGDWVVGGITPIAHVRLLSNRMKHQLAEYTGQAGDHTHIQFNKTSTSKTDSTSGP